MSIKHCTTYFRMSSTASSYFIPSSISANATKTGALPKPATQCTAIHVFGEAAKAVRRRLNQASITCKTKTNIEVIGLKLTFTCKTQSPTHGWKVAPVTGRSYKKSFFN